MYSRCLVLLLVLFVSLLVACNRPEKPSKERSTEVQSPARPTDIQDSQVGDRGPVDGKADTPNDASINAGSTPDSFEDKTGYDTPGGRQNSGESDDEDEKDDEKKRR